jgi:hypothetical protein
MDKKMICTFKVRLTEDNDAVEVTRTFDLKNLTVDDLAEYAAKTIVINEQAAIRRGAKSNRDIVLEKTVEVSKPGTRIINKPLTREELLAKVLQDPELLKQILAAGATLPSAEIDNVA